MDYTLLYSLGCFSYILSSIFFAVIRWGHVCHPYQKYSSSFYPARIMSLYFFLFSILMLPYVFNPLNAEAWVLVKNYGILVIPTAWILLLYRYFDISDYKHKRHWLRLMASIPMLIVLLQFVLTVIPGEISGQQSLQITSISIVFGALLFAYLIYLTFWLNRMVNEKNQDNYSNEEEFPVRLASHLIWQPLAYTSAYWIIIFTDNRLMRAGFDFLLTGWNLWLLLAVLHPGHISKDAMQKLDGMIAMYIQRKNLVPLSDNLIEEEKDSLSRECINRIKADILEIIEQKKGYLNPHLTLASVASQTDYGRTYVSKVFKQEFGGFYNYINRLRLDYAARYAQEHPEANQDEIACHSGFSSRVSQWRAADRLAKNEESNI